MAVIFPIPTDCIFTAALYQDFFLLTAFESQRKSVKKKNNQPAEMPLCMG